MDDFLKLRAKRKLKMDWESAQRRKKEGTDDAMRYRECLEDILENLKEHIVSTYTISTHESQKRWDKPRPTYDMIIIEIRDALEKHKGANRKISTFSRQPRKALL